MRQLGAIIWIRWRMRAHGLRRAEGRLNLLGGALLNILWGLLALGAAAVVSVLIHEALAEGRDDYLFYSFLIAFGFATICGLILPLLLETSRASLDVQRLLIYPISVRRLFWISQAAIAGTFEHLLYLPTLLAVLYFGVIRSGGNLWSGLAILMSLWLFVLVWGHTIGLLFQSLMKKRRNREIVGAVSIVLVIFFAYGPALFGAAHDTASNAESRNSEPDFKGIDRWLNGPGQILVPVQAAHELAATARGASDQLPRCLGWLWGWTVAGWLIGNLFFVRHALGGRGKLPTAARTRTQALPRIRNRDNDAVSSSRFAFQLNFLPGVVQGVAATDWRYLLRSMNGRIVLLMSPVFVAFIVLAYGRKLANPVAGLDVHTALFFGIVFYTSQTLSNYRNNCFTWEGTGAGSYFLYPVSLRKVLLGKNLALLAIHAVLLVINLIVWTVLNGLPSLITLATGLLLLLGLELAFMTLGNFLSLAFPAGSTVSARKIKTPGMAALISVAGLILIGGVHGVFLWATVWFGRPELQPLAMVVILAIDVVSYGILLGPASRLFLRNQEKIIAALRVAAD